MYQDFRVVTIDNDIKTKSITVAFNFDIDPETINSSTIQVYYKSSKNYIEYTPEIDGKNVTIVLREWPQPNAEYVISIQNVKTVLGDELISGVRRKIEFKSSICSRLKITYPAYNEVITDLKLSWEEIVSDPSHLPINSYYIEISPENLFYNLVKKVEVQDRLEIDLSDLPIGQYYVRGRVQKDNEYGIWSDVITFIVGKEHINPGPIYDDDDDEDDIYLPDINIVSTPVNGGTPSSIMIEFDCNIDPDFLKDIVIIRRDI